MCLVGWDKLQKYQSPSPGIFSGYWEMVIGCLPGLDVVVKVSQGRSEQVKAPVQLVALVPTMALAVCGASL